MMHRNRTLGVLWVALMLGGGFAAADRVSAARGQDYLEILPAIPDSALVGETAFEVVVVDAADNPVEDAEVSAQLSMPTMTMAAQPFLVNLAPVGKGWYRGAGHLTMAGPWEVKIDARRSSQQRGSTVVAIEALAPTDTGGGRSRP